MSSVALQFTARLESEECGRCGVQFAMPADLRAQLLRDCSRSFFCPNGHSQHYTGETEAQKLQRQLDLKNRELEWAKADKKRAEKKAARLERRINRGVCPHCNRTFQNVQRHMATKHHEAA